MLARRSLASVLVALVLTACSSSGPGLGDSGGGEGGDGSGSGLVVSSQSVEFGKVSCGAAAPAPKTIELSNRGPAPVGWSATLAPAIAFSISGPAKGTLAPGAKTTLSVAASVVSTASPGALEATLTIVSDDPSSSSVQIPVSLTPAGGILTLSPTPADFGLVPVGQQSEEIAVTLGNEGNEPVTVVLEQPSDPQFTLSWNGAPAPVEIAPGATVSGLVARFKPSKPELVTSSAKLSVTGATCGALPTGINLTGRGSTGVLGLQPGALDFGKVSCGAVASPKTLTLTNSGTAAIAFETAFKAGATSPFTVVPAAGTIPASGKATLTVTPMPVPAVALTGPDLIGDTLTITTDLAGGTPHSVPLHQTAQGARIVAAASIIGFGNLPVSQSKSAALGFVNEGNLPATISLATAAPFSVTPGAAQVLAPAGKLTATVVFKATEVGSATGMLSVTGKPGEVHCAPLPGPIDLAGTGTQGALAVSVSSVAFGDVDCGKQGLAQTIQLMNAGTTSFSWTAKLGKGASSWYTLSLSSGTSKPGDITSTQLTPKAIPATSTPGELPYADTLTIATDIPGDTPQLIPVSMNAYGAVIAFSSSAPVAFDKVPAGSSAANQVTIQNTGTAAASVSLAITGGPVFSLDGLGPFPLGPTDSETVEASFEPVAVGAQSATISLSVPTTTALCAPLPTRQVTGTGTNGTVSLSTTALDFGQTDCGKKAAARTVEVANLGTAGFDFTADILGTAPEVYTVAPAIGHVDPGQSVTLTVTSPTIPSDSAVTADLFADTLTITSDAYGDSPHTVAIHQTARGAVLSATPDYLDLGSVFLGASGSGSFTLANTGNAAVTVSFSSPQPTFTVAPQGQTVAAGGSFVATATFKPTTVGLVQAVTALTVPAGAAVCGVLPTISLEGEGDVP